MGSGDSQRGHWIPLAIVLLTFLVILTGGFVRINDAGESCPDWPKCFDSWGFFASDQDQADFYAENPDQTDSRGSEHRYSRFEIFSEWFHRLLVGIVLVPVCIINILAVRRSETATDPRIHLLAIVVMLLLLLQAFAGSVTVRFDNANWSVALHLTLALVFISAALFQALIWMRAAGSLPPRLVLSPAIAQQFSKRLSLLVGALFSVLFIGAWLATSDQGSHAAACSIGWIQGWPLCQGQLIPEFGEGGTDLQMTHRLAVVLVAGLLGWNTYLMQSNRSESTQVLTHLVSSGFVLLVLNALIGGAYVVLADSDGFPEWLSLTHLAVATLSLMMLVFALLLTHLGHPKAEDE